MSRQNLHHIFVQPIAVGNLCGYFLDISLKTFHVGTGIHECDVVLEIDDAFSFGDSVNPDVKLIQSIFEYIFGALLNIAVFSVTLLFPAIVAIESILEIIV